MALKAGTFIILLFISYALSGRVRASGTSAKTETPKLSATGGRKKRAGVRTRPDPVDLKPLSVPGHHSGGAHLSAKNRTKKQSRAENARKLKEGRYSVRCSLRLAGLVPECDRLKTPKR